MEIIKEILNKKEWENFLIEEKPQSFLQSWNWGNFNESLGYEIWRLGVYEDDVLVGVVLTIKICAKRGRFLFIPHGPILKKTDPATEQHRLRIIFSYLKDLAKKEKCGFVRVSPLLLKNQENENLYRELGFRKAPMHMHAELMWILDISVAEEKLLKDMRKTTRYLVHKAEKDGVEIIKSKDQKHLEIFNNIYKETAKRQKFIAFSENYLKKEFDALYEDNQIEIFLAKYNGEFISGAMVVFYGDSGFYHQGASVQKYTKIPASYLLQWKAIEEAKKRGLKFYNFWGVCSEEKTNHPWAGLSLFKRGFGGFHEEYLAAQDLIISPIYWLNYLIEKARKIKRNL